LINLNNFRRETERYNYIISNGYIYTTEYILNSKFITSLKTYPSIDNKSIASLDIECLNINDDFIPYAVDFYNNNLKYTYG